MSSYIAHPRKTSDALNASVRCEQKRLQSLSETVPANIRTPQAVRQRIPDRRTSHREASTSGLRKVRSYWPALRPYWPGNDLAVLMFWRRHWHRGSQFRI